MNIRRWFGTKTKTQEGNGLSASVEELMAVRRYAAYVQGLNRKYSYGSGDIRSAFKGRGMELEEIRSYNFGDDVRDIDWRVTARKDSPYTKIFNEEKDHEIWVWLDLSASMLFGSKKELKSVTAAKIAALLGWLALENKDRFGAVIFDGRNSWLFKPQNSRSQLLAILKKISLVSEEILKNPHFEDSAQLKSLKMLEQNAKNKATAFIVSGFDAAGGQEQRQLAGLAKKIRLFLVSVFDILEEKAPQSGEYMAEYAGKRLVFDSSNRSFKNAYQSYFAAKKDRLRDFCRRFGGKLIEFRTDWSFADKLKII